MTDYVEPTHCDVCKRSLADLGFVESFRGKVRTRVACTQCDIDGRLATYRETGLISTWLLQAATLDAHTFENGGRARTMLPRADALAIRDAYERILARLKTWAAEVWPSTQREVKACRTHGMSGKNAHVEVLCMASAGRVLFTISTKGDLASITVIGAEDGGPDRFGIQGIQATEAAAIRLLELSQADFPKLRSDTRVGM